MRIAIVGYGRMGHEIERVAGEKHIEVKSIIDPSDPGATHREISRESLDGVDVCIEFTNSGSAIGNIVKISSLRKNIVVGTTGWYGDIGKAKEIIRKSGTGLIYASNFSVGVALFFRIVRDASRIMDEFDEFDAYGYELHHSQKSDSPSGTAKTLGDIMVKNIGRKKKLVYDRLDRKIEPHELHFPSVRAGFIAGTHVVGFDSISDSIEIRHAAKNREGFAYGAIKAAQWIQRRKGFYVIDDMMKKTGI